MKKPFLLFRFIFPGGKPPELPPSVFPPFTRLFLQRSRQSRSTILVVWPELRYRRKRRKGKGKVYEGRDSAGLDIDCFSLEKVFIMGKSTS
jgi:hypothetical protein